MSPVRPPRQTSRSAAIAVGGLLFVLALLVAFVISVPKLTESGTLQVALGTDTFDAGNAELRAPSIAEQGPLLLPDPASGERDIFVQHLGDDPVAGWSAFDARLPGTTRACTLRWDRERRDFTDPCTGRRIPADGAGLPHYPVTIDGERHVIIDLRPEAGPSLAPATGTSAPATSPPTRPS